MKIGVGIDERLGLSRHQQRELVRESARLGYESLWTPAGATARSALHRCADWSFATSEVVDGGLTVGISVVPFPAWSVTTLAAEAATLGELTGGRFNLGIGLGSYPSDADRLGLRVVPPVRATREYTQALRGLLNGESVNMQGDFTTLQDVALTFKPPRVPVYVAALGEQMLRLSGMLADGVSPNWTSPEQIPWLRERVAEGARRAGRDPGDIPFAQYIRVCVDDDEQAARRAFAVQVLSYALARPGQPTDRGYRGHFGRMGFEQVLTDLEARRASGVPLEELIDAVPEVLLRKVGYFGKASGAPAELQRLSQGLDEAMVRLIAVRQGDLDANLAAVRACEPGGWRA